MDTFLKSKPHPPSERTSGKILAQSDSASDLSKNRSWANALYENEVFVSYAWGGESEQIVDELEQVFAQKGIRIIRDKKDLNYKGSIKQFENRIGRGQCVILVISDKYLRSEHCMYELVEVEKNQSLRERIFPIVLADAHIYRAIDRITYIQHWEQQIEQLDQALKKVGRLTNLGGVTEDLNIYDRIRSNIDHLTDILSDMNVLTPDIHAQSGFSSLISSIENVMYEGIKASSSTKLPAQVYQTSSNTSEITPEQYAKSMEDHFLRLTDWSLLLEDEDIKSGTMEYFHMHALLHEFAHSILTDPTEIEEAIHTHIQYCVAFADSNAQIDLQKQQKSTLEFEKSYGQLLQALAQIQECYLLKTQNWKNNPELCQQIIPLVTALDNHWQNHSQFDEQLEWLQIAYACAEEVRNTIKQADFARRLGRVLSWQGKLDEALAWMKRSEAALRDVQSKEANPIQALMYIHRSSINLQRADIENAEADCIRGIELMDGMTYSRIYAEGYNLLGAIKIQNGDLDAALDAFQKSLSAWIQAGDQYQINRVEDNIRTTLYYLGDIANLRKAEDASVHYWEQFPNRIELGMALTNRGLVYGLDGEHERAIKLHTRAIKISDLLGVPRIQAMTRVNIAGSYLSLEKFDEAENHLQKSLEIQAEHEIKEYWIDTKRSLAEVAIGRKSGQKAMELAIEAAELAREGEEPLEQGAALRTLGQAYHLLGDLDRALESLEESLGYLRENGFKYESYLTLLAMAKVHKDLGQPEKERETEKEAQILSERMGLILPGYTANKT